MLHFEHKTYVPQTLGNIKCSVGPLFGALASFGNEAMKELYHFRVITLQVFTYKLTIL